MNFSTKGRYGLRAMVVLSLNYGKGPISLKKISKIEGVSENYLEQLFALLKKNNLIKSVRGAYGGYLLNRAPEEISVGDILIALEGPIGPFECVMDGKEESCENIENCVSRIVWKKVKVSVEDVINKMSLKELTEEKIEMLKNKEGVDNNG